MLLCRGRLRLTGWQASPRFTHALAAHAGPNQLNVVSSGAGWAVEPTHLLQKKNRCCTIRRAVDIRCTTGRSITLFSHRLPGVLARGQGVLLNAAVGVGAEGPLRFSY